MWFGGTANATSADESATQGPEAAILPITHSSRSVATEVKYCNKKKVRRTSTRIMMKFIKERNDEIYANPKFLSCTH
jgi:hypothetical protein